MVGLFLPLIHPKSGGADDTAATRPFWGMAPIFWKDRHKKAPNHFLDNIIWLKPTDIPVYFPAQNAKH